MTTEEKQGEQLEEKQKPQETREEAQKSGEQAAKTGQEKELDRMTVKELRLLAAEITDLVGVHAMKKDELLAAIKKAKGIEDTSTKIKEKKEISVKQIKTHILELKQKRQEARQAHDKKSLGILRRKINRLRKRTRKLVQA